jgi:hypothetical protein
MSLPRSASVAAVPGRVYSHADLINKVAMLLSARALPESDESEPGEELSGLALHICYVALAIEHRAIPETGVTLAHLRSRAAALQPGFLAMVIGPLVRAGYLNYVSAPDGADLGDRIAGLDPKAIVVVRGPMARQIDHSVQGLYESVAERTRAREAWPELIPLWRLLAIEDAVTYLGQEFARHGLPGSFAGTIRPLFARFIEDVSLSQLINLAWGGSRDCASAYMRNHGQIDIALQHMHAGMQRRLVDHRKGYRGIKGFNLPARWCYSTAADLLRNHATGLGPRYVDSVPQLKALLPG